MVKRTPEVRVTRPVYLTISDGMAGVHDGVLAVRRTRKSTSLGSYYRTRGAFIGGQSATLLTLLSYNWMTLSLLSGWPVLPSNQAENVYSVRVFSTCVSTAAHSTWGQASGPQLRCYVNHSCMLEQL